MGLCVCVIGLLFSIVGTATPAWQTVTGKTEAGTTSTTEGLFRSCVTACVSGVCTNRCAQYSGTAIDSSIHAVRAMCIIGILLGIGCTIGVVFYVFVRSDLNLLRVTGVVLAFIAGFFNLAGIMIFATERSSLGKYAYSFALEIVGGILFLTTGGLLLLG